jgi:3-deoxy-manno-octulosonate cytidylyltransferase (CMP-KDO synthetase)
MRSIAIIPARYHSLRFPGKLMTPLLGDPLIAHTVQRVRRAQRVNSVVVVTDDDCIAGAVRDHCDVVLRTPASLRFDSGTERVAWAARELMTNAERQGTYVVNVQGDQPCVDPAAVDAVLKLASESSHEADVATLCTTIRSTSELHDSGCVKCVLDVNGNAMYFSRSQIPFIRDRKIADPDLGRSAGSCGLPLRHLGLYAFAADVLVDRLAVMERCSIEVDERLEQLRWLFHGARIRVGCVPHAWCSVDAPCDVEKVVQEMVALKS